MPVAIDGTRVPEKLKTMNCGGTPMWDYPSACSWRCDVCNAIIGSVGQPRKCVEINKAKSEEG